MDNYTKLVKWYELHRDGVKEYEDPITIKTIVNPNFYLTMELKINLKNTCLSTQSIELSIDNSIDDWMTVEVVNDNFLSFFSFNNLEKVLKVFFEEFFLKNKWDYLYTVYLPIINSDSRFLKSYAVITNDLKFRILKILEPIPENIFNVSPSEQSKPDKIIYSHKFKEGEIINTYLFSKEPYSLRVARKL